ncbi:transmembrane protein 168-like [Cololabis saira]|uniref:transmembrane protein 168-like n=1 Tax=Cololabis saira TaxID=129043 RepID=UPI002AD38F7E|nr:transmembrane protein 168-like [Cololabis saira]
MWRFVRYCVSRGLRAVSGQGSGAVTWSTLVTWLGYLSGLALVLAPVLALQARWAAPVLALALLVPAAAGLLHARFGLERLGPGMVYLWFGFLLGLLCFQGPEGRGGPGGPGPGERAAGLLLPAGVALRTVWLLLDRVLGTEGKEPLFMRSQKERTRQRPALLTSAEQLVLLGFSAASAALLVPAGLSVAVLVSALAAVMVALRMKVLLALPGLACFAAVAGLQFFPALGVATDPAALACFFSLLLCEPLLDVVFSGLSVTERWQPYLARRALWRRLSLLPLLLLELLFVALAARKPSHSDRWYVLVPGFVLCLVFWAICHTVFVITAWGFHSKLSDCQRLCLSQGPDGTSLDKVMASRGMRHFCLISQRLVLFSLVSTGAVAALCWQASSSIFVSVFLLVLPLESLFHGLFYELGNSLGGTCVGYAVVIPTNYCSPDGQPTLLPPGQVHELNKRSTGMLSSVQRFFAHHMIENHGCDYSTSGVTAEALQARIKAFLELRTADGPRHDTYVVFYSGHTRRCGDWALAGGDALRLPQILDWWREKNGGSCSRLILVLDCEDSLPWVKEVRRVEGPYVAVQGAELARGADVEQQEPPQLGDFTAQWVEYNCNPSSGVQWCRRGRAVSAAYGVSRHWSDYTLHLPTGSDVTSHWSLFFPRVTYPVVQLALWCGSLNLLWICGVCLRCLRRVKLNWFPPAVLDTGQGFKLVRS